MGGGSWSKADYTTYASTTYGAKSFSTSGAITDSLSHQEMFKKRSLDSALDPMNVMRECCDTEEHPYTKPVILALDVTGSMGDTALEVAKKLNSIMSDLYKEIEDIEFCIMGIGDLYCDRYPIQMSQFESDIRIAESLDKVYFEFGGGANAWESYTAAWYMGSRHTKLDCTSRGEKGTIITIGDEKLNPTLNHVELMQATGDALQAPVETVTLYNEVTKVFDVWHIDVSKGRRIRTLLPDLAESWGILGDHFLEADGVESVPQLVSSILLGKYSGKPFTGELGTVGESSEGISW